MHERKLMKIKNHEALVAFLFLLPMTVVFVFFKYLPLIDNFRIALTSWNLFSPKRYVGFANFKALLTSSLFYKILGNTFFFTIMSTAISVALGFILSVLLFHRNGKGGKILKTLFFIPNVTTASAVAILWMWVFDPDFGLSGQICTLLGIKSPRWLLDERYAIWVVIALSVWRSVGYVMLIFESGLSGIPDEIYEAAKIDGANGIQTLFGITIPLLSSTSYFLITTSLIQTMQVFDIVSVMTGGGPFNSTNVMNLYIYQMAFARNKAGYAAALSVMLFLILLILTVVQRRLAPEKKVEYA